MRGNRCIGIPCTVSFAMMSTWQPQGRMRNRDDQAKAPLDLWNSDEITQNTCPLDNECDSHREYAVTLSKNYYITWERWGRCPYPARFVGLAKGKLAVKYDDCGLTCSRL